jgi:hypothetical protein
MTISDNWDDADRTANPARGVEFVFNNSAYVTVGDKSPISGQVIIIDRAEGWRFLKAGCQPEWIMRRLGEPKPEQPICPEETWPVSSYSGEPECPWKYTLYIQGLKVGTGEAVTFATSTIGGRVAVDELTDQIQSMRRLGRAGALPIIELCTKMMPTKKFGNRPRPWFKIVGWKFPQRAAEPLKQVETLNSADAVGEPDANVFDDSVNF